MTHIPKFDFTLIENIPAHELLKLPHEDLDAFIEQAIEIGRSATIIANWLISIKYEKSLREEDARNEKAGENA